MLEPDSNVMCVDETTNKFFYQELSKKIPGVKEVIMGDCPKLEGYMEYYFKQAN